jgi:hypothetical protein
MWANSPSDVWLSGARGLMHFDGKEVRLVVEGATDAPTLRRSDAARGVGDTWGDVGGG